MQSSYTTCLDKRHISLVLPGLLAAEAVGAQTLHTPALCRLLSHATRSHGNIEGLESLVFNWFHDIDNSDQNCAARLGYEFELNNSASAEFILRADPVFQQMDINHAVLADQSVLDLELAEACALAETINIHFAADGVEFKMADPCRWYCSLRQPLDIHSNSLSKSVGRDVASESVSGADASTWRSWLAEIEMLLYSHPVNVQRQATGSAVVNSLWLWGEGDLPPKLIVEAADVAVFSNNFYCDSVAHHAGVPVSELSSFADFNHTDCGVLVVDDRLARAAVTADQSLRTEALQDLEQQIFQPLWRCLGSGVESVRIWLGGDQWLQVNAGARFRFWRKQRPLQHFIDTDGTYDRGGSE